MSSGRGEYTLRGNLVLLSSGVLPIVAGLKGDHIVYVTLIEENGLGE